MSLNITYVNAEPEPTKKINWRDLLKGTVFTMDEHSICLKTDKNFVVLTASGDYEFFHPNFSPDHGWDRQSVKVIGKLTGIEITK